MRHEPAYCPLEERARRRPLDPGAADAAKKGDGPGHAVRDAQIYAP
jgi:hypothetical protein